MYKGAYIHYKLLFDKQLHETQRYKADLYEAWRIIRQQQKGLNRQARKIKYLKNKINSDKQEVE